jgi:hypothetical protein
MIAVSPVERSSLKTAARVLVLRVGGLEAAATVCRLEKSALAATYDPHRPDRTMPVDVVADLERVAGEPAMTRALAQLAGCILLPVDVAPGPEASAIAAVLGGAGEVGRAWAQAMGDAALSDGERQAVVGGLMELQAACMQAVASLQPDRAKGEV